MESEEKKKIERLKNIRLENEIKSQELTLQEKAYLEEELKKAHGSNWRKVLGFTGRLTKQAFDYLMTTTRNSPAMRSIREKSKPF